MTRAQAKRKLIQLRRCNEIAIKSRLKCASLQIIGSTTYKALDKRANENDDKAEALFAELLSWFDDENAPVRKRASRKATANADIEV